MKLVPIPKNEYENYRLDVIFNGYKWDPQFLDDGTIAKHVLVITQEEHKELKTLTEKLDNETKNAEEAINNNKNLAKPLKLPWKIRKELNTMKNYQAEKHIRLTRYDFHPVEENNWALSEVNSDVPGGLAEASLMPEIAAKLLQDKDNKNYTYNKFSDTLSEVITKKINPGGKIAFIHCTSYSDDRQVMQFLGDTVASIGFKAIYAAADHLKFENNEAISILDGNEGKVDAIIRFTPLEWIINMKPKRWGGYFNTITTSCNHPIAIFAQTKRFPLIWNELEKNGINLSTWRKLLPETHEVKDQKTGEGYIFKPIYGRVGEKISIKEACKGNEYEEILRDVKKNPKNYIAQKRFDSKAIISEDNLKYHLCIGSYCIDGKAAGYYARISEKPRIDSCALDIPVLIEKKVEK